MSISPLSRTTYQVPSVKSTKVAESPPPFPKEITIRLRMLGLLAHKVLEHSPHLFTLIDYIDEKSSRLSYQRCEELFIEAFVHEFDAGQIHNFLDNFFNELDPQKQQVDICQLDTAGQKLLWELLARFYCWEYMGFDSETPSLEGILEQVQNKTGSSFLLVRPQEITIGQLLKAKFEDIFTAMSILSPDESLEIKFLLIHYVALLIVALEKFENEKSADFNLEGPFTIHDLFEEIYFLLLRAPFLSQEENVSLLDLHTTIDYLDPVSLKACFLDLLIADLTEDSDPDYFANAQIIKEVMGKTLFFDYQLKSYLQTLIAQSSKKMLK